MENMVSYPQAAVERAMRIQEVILRAMAKKITWWQAAEILGITDRQLRRRRERYERLGYDGLFDRRRGRPSPRRVPLATVEKVLELYRERYPGFSVQHFYEKLGEEHGIKLSYTWVKMALQGAGLVARRKKRGVHRKRRPRRPLPGMMLHIDGSRHRWFQDERSYDLILVLDDATNEVYYARLVEEESTMTVMAALKEVVATHGVFCSLYSDRGSHFWYTPKAGARVAVERPTQVGRAMRQLGVEMIAAYSPQARGRCERSFSTWQGRLPNELSSRKIDTLEAANRFLRESYIAKFNQQFQVPAAQAGSAFVRRRTDDLDWIFSQQFERKVGQDNTVAFENLRLQIEAVQWRSTLAGCSVIVHQHLDQSLSILYGPHCLGRYDAQGITLKGRKGASQKPMEKTRAGKVQPQTFPSRLEIPQKARDSHFPTAPTASGYYLKTGHFTS